MNKPPKIHLFVILVFVLGICTVPEEREEVLEVVAPVVEAIVLVFFFFDE